MTTEISHLIAGILVVLVGVAALASPVYRNFKEQDPAVDHLKVRHVIISILTIVVGLLIASNRIDEVVDMVRRFGAMISGAGT